MRRGKPVSGSRLASGVVLVLALSVLVSIAVSCSGGAPAKWKDGSYKGKAEGLHGDIALTVTVAKGRIAKITVDSQEETAGVADLAFERVPKLIIEKQTTEVDAVSGSSVSSKAIMAAVQDALDKAKNQ
jgi:uncharacterized protein with FMN-binding domain